MTKGIAKGVAKGQVDLMLTQLRARFGELAPDIEQRVRACDPAGLESLAIRLLDAKKLRELFGEE